MESYKFAGGSYRLKDRRRTGLLPMPEREGHAAAAVSSVPISTPPKARRLKATLGSVPTGTEERKF